MCDRRSKFRPGGQSNRWPGEDVAECPQLVPAANNGCVHLGRWKMNTTWWVHNTSISCKGTLSNTSQRFSKKYTCQTGIVALLQSCALPSSATCLVSSTSAGQHRRELTYFRWEKNHKIGIGWEKNHKLGKFKLTSFAWTFPRQGKKVGSPGRPSLDIPMRARAASISYRE